MTDLFSSFPKMTTAAWEKKIITELENLNFTETLVSSTPEGIPILPFYTNELHALSHLSHLPKSKTGWEIFTDFTVYSHLKPGEVDGIFIDLEKTKPIEGYKNIIRCKNLETLKTLDPLNKNIFLALDIYGHLSETGNWFLNQRSDESFVKELIEKLNFEKSICIQNSIFQNAGANIIEQLALALSHTNEYIETFGNEIVKHIFYTFSVGNNYFFEIAKLRAFRFLLKIFLESKNIHSEAYLITETSYRNKSLFDNYNNVIRNTLASSSAIFGGTNALLIHAHDSYSKEDSINNFSAELAHKIQLILKKESYLDLFKDPMAGNYYVEHITNQMIEKAGHLFKEIENKGGLIEGIKTGFIQKMITISHNKEQDQFDQQKQVLIGENTNKNTEEKISPLLPNKNPSNNLLEPIVQKRILEKTDYANTR